MSMKALTLVVLKQWAARHERRDRNNRRNPFGWRVPTKSELNELFNNRTTNYRRL
jgi:hypothetical protein